MPRVDVQQGLPQDVALDTDGPSPHLAGTKADGYWELEGQVANGETKDNPGIWGTSFEFDLADHPTVCTVTVPSDAPLGELDILHHGGVAPNDCAVMHQHNFLISITDGAPDKPDAPTVETAQTTANSITVTTPVLPNGAHILRVEWTLAGQGNWQSAGNQSPQTPVTVAGLNAVTDYEWRVVAVNTDNSLATASDSVTERTRCEAPAIAVNDAEVVISWSIVNGATAYKIKEDGLEIDTVTGTQYSRAIPINASKRYTIAAVDDNSIPSADSNELNVQVVV